MLDIGNKLAIIKTTVGPLKQEIGFDKEAADETLFGRVVTILKEERDGWYYVETDYRYRGYIHKNHLLLDEEKAKEWVTEARHIVKHGIVDIMKEPKYQSYPIALVTGGAIIKQTGKAHGNWIEIVLPTGEKGWIRKEFIKERTNLEKRLEENELRQSVVNTALTYIGTQYRWGGKTPLGIDCSGLTSIAYLINGVTIYRDSKIKEDFGMRRISIEDIKPGDLLYWPGHVAMYLGNHKYIHSTGAAGGVVINSLCPDHEDYREDLADVKEVGTIF